MNGESWWEFVVDRLPELWLRLGQHLTLTGAAIFLAVLIGIPCGILATRWPALRSSILASVGILQTIPSLAMLTLLLALFHRIGAMPAIVALTLYALLPIVRNTIAGLDSVSKDVLQAAVGIGMTPSQQLSMVRLPLALPIIIAGVRTAAVTCVGVATLAAFIGAGGLGQFINRGLALANTPLILLGAIPAALLAIVVDFAVSAAGWALSPERRVGRSEQKFQTLQAAALLVPFLVFGAGGMAYVGSSPDIVVGSKIWSESLILGHMMADLIEDATDLKVDRRFCLGGTMICHGALVNGEIDMYVEYTGTGLTTVLHATSANDPQTVYDTVKTSYEEQFAVEWFPPLGINNTYALAVRKDAAEKNGWRRISDLQESAVDLTAGWTAEFAERPDGYLGLSKMYEFEFGTVVDIQSGLMYAAVAAGEVDVIAAYSTDGRIAAYDLLLLEDDRRFFPPYFAAPVVKQATLEKYPDVGRSLLKLANILDDRTMQQLNLEVDEHKRNPEEVAREFLVKRGLVK